MTRPTRLALAVLSIAGLACASSPGAPVDPVALLYEPAWLSATADLVDARMLLILLREGRTPEAIEALESQIDTAVLVLEGISRLDEAHGISEERRQTLHRHLRAVKRDRERRPRQSRDPQFDALVREALARVPSLPGDEGHPDRCEQPRPAMERP